MRATLRGAARARAVRWARWISVAIGCAALALIAVAGEMAEKLASLAFVALAGAVALAMIETLAVGERRDPSPPTPAPADRRRWWLATALVGLGVGLPMQTWFRAGTVLAQGDITIPGTAWLGRVFDAWVPTGSNLGGPGSLELQLPWAAVLGAVTAAGGDPGLAQRVFFTSLLVAAALAALLLMRSLGLGAWAGAAAALVYVYNGYVLTAVNFNPVYMGAMVLLALYPAIVLLVARRRLPGVLAALVMAATAPLLGLAYQNPPLVGMALGCLVLAPLLAGWLWGRDALLRGAAGMLVGGVALAAASAYWIIPASHVLDTVDSTRLAAVSGWAWTQRRSTLGNGFWLNNSWGWDFGE
ncbi:MAG: arabinofuranan 3-O-arabinosyltransferase [Chloroflexota bacterium]|nr:arabinofuranan 3-O-arabinosyltransferase [Chloroflexota bacterium]